MRPEDHRTMRWAFWLVGATIAYNVVEAGSIALFGFGLDSVIECAAAAVLLWRLLVETRSHDEERVEQAERRVLRFVGFTFIALAVYVISQATITLVTRGEPDTSLVGIVLAAASLVVMPGLAAAKLRVAARMRSGALAAEAKETLACAYLSFALLTGLLLHSLLGWWWADPVAALSMVPWLAWEGVEGIRGEDEAGRP